MPLLNSTKISKMPKVAGNYCYVKGCYSRASKDGGIVRHYYRLPATITNQGSECEALSTERRRLWLASLKQDFNGKNLANVRVCSDHFVNKKKASLYQQDSPDWVPTINMSTEDRAKLDTKSPAANARYIRKVQRNKKKSAAASLMKLSQCDLPETLELDKSLETLEPETSLATQTDIDQPLYLAMTEEIQILRTENIDLKEQVLTLSNSHKIEEFRGKDDKVNCYTGLATFQVLSAVYNHVEKDLPKKQSLDKFQFLIMCLMRMRLNLPLQFLAFEFCISVSTASRYFNDAVSVLYDKYITEYSDFLTHNAGDKNMADRGVDIANSLGRLAAVAKLPVFTKARDQLSAHDIESTRKVSICKNRMNIVIGLVKKKYTMLSGTVPADMLSCRNNENTIQLDKVVFVACCLANMCPSVVDLN